jgi:hypothetical protein
VNDKQEGSKEQNQAEPTPPPPTARIPSTNPPPVPTINSQSAAYISNNELPRNPPPIEKLSKNDKVMICLTGVIALGTLVSALAIGMQWREMVGGGHQTDQIIEAANKSKEAAERSAQAARDFSDNAAKINMGIGEAVGKLNIQAQQTKELAQTSKDALHISERAYIEVGVGPFDIPSKRLQLPINNSGHLPSGRAKITVHEETLDMSLFSATHNANVIERHWTEDEFTSFAPGNSTFINVFMPKLDSQQISLNRQKIVVTGTVIYNDGFSGTPEQKWQFCIGSDLRPGTDTPVLFPCNPNEQLPIAVADDKYPDPQYRSAH